ncbi:hypothetical protein BGW39_002603 [Mortierella sp. 14UC]|nr:hypothetical protein BGW39_002603 [Mortierella sp. 14UC]
MDTPTTTLSVTSSSELILPDAPTTLAELVHCVNAAVSETFSSITTTNTEPATTNPAATDTVMMATVGTGTDDTGVTSTSGLRRSSRVARNIQAKADAADTTEGSTTSAPAPTETATKRRARGGKGKKVADPGNAEIQQAQQEEENSSPRKRRKKVAAKNTTTTDDGQSGGDGSPGEGIVDEGDVGSSTKQESAPSPTPKKSGRRPKYSTDSGTITTMTHKEKTKAAADKKGKGKINATVDPTSLDNMDDRASTGDVGGQDQSDMFIQAISAPPVIDPQEPFSSLPVEILQQILSWLPLPEIARISTVSKAWLDAVHYLSIWKTVCQEAKLGEPKRKYRTHMALACANSYWICTRCYSYTDAKTHRADLPLPVKDVDDNERIYMLCLKCRREYYHKHPQAFKKGVYRNEFAWVPRAGSIAPNGIFLNYDLSESQLDELETVGTSGQGLPLYDRFEVQKLALRTHGGWVGVNAGASNPRRKRVSACSARAKAAKTCTHRPSVTPKMLERSRIAAEKREIREEEKERRREEREEELWERRRERAYWRRLDYEMRHPERSWERRHYY